MVHRVGMMEILRLSIGEREGVGAVLRMMSDVTAASGRSAWRRTLLPDSKVGTRSLPLTLYTRYLAFIWTAGRAAITNPSLSL